MTMLPLYPSEAEIAVAVLGTKRAREWLSLAKFLEDKEGLPRIDPQMGGRYWPLVEAYFRRRHAEAMLPQVAARSRIQTFPFDPDRLRGAKK